MNKMSQHSRSTFAFFSFSICMICVVGGHSSHEKTKIASDREGEYSDLNLTEYNSTGKVRVKRYIGTESLFFLETELQIRIRIRSGSQMDLTLLPKFGGENANPPYINLIQVSVYTRSYPDGPMDGDYGLTTGDTISVSVDPTLHRFTKGKWTVFAGSRVQRCFPQLLYGNGHKAVFDCFADGTYYAFFRVDGTYKDEHDVIDGEPFRDSEEAVSFFDIPHFTSHFIDAKTFFPDYENELLQDPNSVAKPWYFSDPIKIVKDSYCYRWSYRLIKENEVGFVHLEPNPMAVGGVYREYTLKVWIVDPAAATQEELNSPVRTTPSPYSQIITRRFYLSGLVPCIRHAHAAIEVITDAEYAQDWEQGRVNDRVDGGRIAGPHWNFRIKVYMDRIVSTLRDLVLTITPRQHTALFDCFIADVRVYISARAQVFLPHSKASAGAINLDYSTLSSVERHFHEHHVGNYYGHEVVYVGPPYLRENTAAVTVFSNPCINQELAVSWRGAMGMSNDFFVRNELIRLVLPNFDKTQMGLHATGLRLSEGERDEQLKRSNNANYARDMKLRMEIFSLAYTPVDLIFLTSDSTLYLHSTDLSLRGIGYNTISQKYKLARLVQRTWCASTSTPKNHNMWVPGFSRDHGNFIIIYHIPAEGVRVISRQESTPACEQIRDTTKNGRREETQTLTVDEKEIHKDEADDARIDLAVQAKLRTAAAAAKAAKRAATRVQPVTLRRSDLSQHRTFWLFGKEVLKEEDPHYASGDTEARNVRVATTGLEHYNENIIFRIDVDFQRLRRSFETSGLSFAMDEHVYTTGGDQLVRDAPNNRLFSLHSVQFTGVEKRYLLAVGFQSAEFPKTIAHINSTLVMVVAFLANDLPVVLNGTLVEKDIELERVDVSISGTIIRRTQNSHSREADAYTLLPEDFVDPAGRTIVPGPLSRLTTKVHSINTATPIYVLGINDVIIFASLDGSFAKPVQCYEDYPIHDSDVTPKAYFPFTMFDISVTEQGVISALSNKEFSGNDSAIPSQAFIGSVLANEPLRFIHPFHVSNNVFQAVTEEGEIVYGHMSYNEKTESVDSPPQSTMLSLPFWAYLKGSFARSAGDGNIPLDRHVASQGSAEFRNYADPLCPFASFDVYFVVFPYVEAQYTTRITTELAFYGDVIPLEADLIVEFTEVQGVSVVVASFLEVNYDQTVVRKTIEIETFLPIPQLEEMYTRHHLFQNDDESTAQREEVRVFTLTIRPSLLNLHCQKDHYFKTIQLNIGCVPFTRVRLIAEALPLKKVDVFPWRLGLTTQDRENNWFHEGPGPDEPGIAHLIIPRASMHHSQRGISGCENRNITFCRFKIPAGKGIENNVYGLSFRDVLVPKFEQFLSRHARRVTGNVVIYDILDSYKHPEDPLDPGNHFRIQTNTTQFNAQCLIDDDDWYGKMAVKANFYRKNELSLKADIYRHFTNCFSRRPSYKVEDWNKPDKALLPIEELNNRTFFIFNRTNANALTLQKKRNFIYLFRAVVVNTESNAFTYCSNLDTFFALQVANIAPQRIPLPWELYCIVTIVIFFIVLCFYVYFARYKHWRTRIVTNRILAEDMEVEDELQAQLEREELERNDPFKRVAEKAANLQRFHEMSASVNAARSAQSVVAPVEWKPVTLNLLQRRLSSLDMPKLPVKQQE